MESENQLLRQQSLVVASADEDKSKQIERYLAFTSFFSFWTAFIYYEKGSQVKGNGLFRLESKIATLESEIQLLRSNSVIAVQAIVTPEMNQTSIMEVNFLETNFGKTLVWNIYHLITKRIALNFLTEPRSQGN
jgi:myosin-5